MINRVTSGLLRIFSKIREALIQVSLAVWVAGLVALSTAGFIGLGAMYFLLERHNSELLSKNNTYIILEKSVIGMEGRLGTAQALAANADKVPLKDLRAALKALSMSVGDVRKANKVDVLNGYISQIEQAVAKASNLLGASPLKKAALVKILEDASSSIGTLSYIAGEGSQSEWQNLLAGKKSNLMTIAILIAIASIVIGLLGLFTTRRIRQVISDVIRINSAIIDGDTSVQIPVAAEKSETGKLYLALRKFRDSVDEQTKLEAQSRAADEIAAQRQSKIAELIDIFRGSIKQSIDGVTQQIGEMRTAAVSVTNIASEMTGYSTSAESASLESSQSVQSVAFGAEELANSINLINQQVSETAQIIESAATNAETTSDKIDGLSKSAQKIGDILSLITDIAEQTNVLALNATIEAARAGEAGRGFTVVASEVKVLAGQSAKAAGEIASQISEIQSSTGDAVGAIREISEIMGNIDRYTTTISEGMKEQHLATDTISQNAQLAASGAGTVEQAMSDVSTSVDKNTDAATQVMSAVREVSEQASDLQGKIDSFLTDVAAA